jgi:hypothetical protein
LVKSNHLYIPVLQITPIYPCWYPPGGHVPAMGSHDLFIQWQYWVHLSPTFPDIHDVNNNHDSEEAITNWYSKKTLITFGTQDTGRRQTHTQHRKYKQTKVNPGVLEVSAIPISYKTLVMLFKMCLSPL